MRDEVGFFIKPSFLHAQWDFDLINRTRTLEVVSENEWGQGD